MRSTTKKSMSYEKSCKMHDKLIAMIERNDIKRQKSERIPKHKIRVWVKNNK